MKKPIKIGILSALEEEQAGIHTHITDMQTERIGNRIYSYGKLWGIDSVAVLSGIGKVAAASTTAILAERFKVTHVLMTGVAGSALPDIKVGDIVVTKESVQHDMDARPLFPRFEIPSAGIARFKSDPLFTEDLFRSCSQYLDGDFAAVVDDDDKTAFNIVSPKVHCGLIASGDLFVNCREKLASIKEALPDLLAVEMEGAAAAQVCHEFGINFAAMRTISDNADEASAIDFNRFIRRVAAVYAIHIIRRLCGSASLASIR